LPWQGAQYAWYKTLPLFIVEELLGTGFARSAAALGTGHEFDCALLNFWPKEKTTLRIRIFKRYRRSFELFIIFEIKLKGGILETLFIVTTINVATSDCFTKFR
jgi:hypothetical protein